MEPARVRTSELSLMILELVKSGRGVAALPNWVLATPIAQNQIAASRLGNQGLWSTLYAATRDADRRLAYLNAFVESARRTAERTLSGIMSV